MDRVGVGSGVEGLERGAKAGDMDMSLVEVALERTKSAAGGDETFGAGERMGGSEGESDMDEENDKTDWTVGRATAGLEATIEREDDKGENKTHDDWTGDTDEITRGVEEDDRDG